MARQHEAVEQNNGEFSEAAPPSRGSRIRLIIGLLIAVGGFYVLGSSMMEGGQYSTTPDEIMATGAPQTGKMMRIVGTATKGAYKHEEGTTVHTFRVQGDEHAFDVYFDGAMPDTFAEGREVTVEGSFTSSNPVLFTATDVTAKCPSKYENTEPTEGTKERMHPDAIPRVNRPGMDTPAAPQ